MLPYGNALQTPLPTLRRRRQRRTSSLPHRDRSWLSHLLGDETLRLAPARVQDPLGIAVGLRASLEDQIAGGREGRAAERSRHRAIVRITNVLPVDHLGHPLERCHHLRLVDDAM